MDRPSGENATDMIIAVCPSKAKQCTRRRVPQKDAIVRAAGSYPAAVRRDGTRGYLRPVTIEVARLLSGGNVPKPQRAIIAAGEHMATIRQERYGAHPRRMT